MAEELTGAELERCVRRAQQGPRSAFTTLYRAFASDVARALASFAGPDRATLDDLVQDVFLRAIDGLDGYRNSTGFRPWLFTITLNVGRNHVRRRRSFHHEPSETVEYALQDRFVRRRTRSTWRWAAAVTVALVLGFVSGRMSATPAPVETATTTHVESTTHDFVWVPAGEDLVEVAVAVGGG